MIFFFFCIGRSTRVIDLPEADAAELAGAVGELADGDAHAGLVLLHPLGGLQVARVAHGHGRLVQRRRGGARRVEVRRCRRGRRGGVEQVEVVRPHVVRRVRHGRGRRVARWSGRRRRRRGHRPARRGAGDRLLPAGRRRRQDHHRALPRRAGAGVERRIPLHAQTPEFQTVISSETKTEDVLRAGRPTHHTDLRGGVVDGGRRRGDALLPAERLHVVELHHAVVVLPPPPLRLPLVEYLAAAHPHAQVLVS